MVYPDQYDRNPYYNDTNGIHFFINRRAAIEYCNVCIDAAGELSESHRSTALS